jgi:hypothetical protein
MSCDMKPEISAHTALPLFAEKLGLLLYSRLYSTSNEALTWFELLDKSQDCNKKSEKCRGAHTASRIPLRRQHLRHFHL